MTLKPATENALNAWLTVGTWHTSHDDDMNRWYDFVNQYQREHGYEIEESRLREYIESRIGKLSEHLRETVSKRINLAYDILDFLKQIRH